MATTKKAQEAPVEVLRQIQVSKNARTGNWVWRLINDATQETLAYCIKPNAKRGPVTQAAMREQKLYRPGTCVVVIIEEE